MLKSLTMLAMFLATHWKEAFVPATWSNWVLAGLAFWAGCSALKTMRAIQLQATAQMNADRAWVLASVHGQPKEPLTGSLIHGYMPGIVWQIQVVGNTPARIISEKYRCRIVPAEETIFLPKPALEPTPVYLPNTASIVDEIVFPPEYKYMVSIPLEPEFCTMEQLVAVTQNTAALCAYGRIEYEDAFKRKGTTQFCAVYQRSGAVIQSPDGKVLNPPGFRIGGPSGYNSNT